MNIKSPFVRNVITLMTGTTVAQFIPIAISPILTRMYDPQEFGVMAIFVACSAVFVGFFTGRFEVAIMLPRRDQHAFNLLVMSVVLCCFLSAILGFLFYYFGGRVVVFFEYPGLMPWLYLIPVNIVLTGIGLSLTYWANRQKKYKQLSYSRIAKAVVVASVGLVMGYYGFGAEGLLISLMIGQLVAIFFLLACIPVGGFNSVYGVSPKRFFVLFKRYKDFPLFNAPSAFLNSMASNAPSFIMGSYYGVSQVGFYGLTTRVVQAPAILIGGAVGQVYHQKIASELHKGNALTPVLLNTSKMLFIIGIFPAISIFMYGPEIFKFIFGEAWETSGKYAQILVIAFLVKFSVSPISTIFSVSGFIKRGALWRLSYFVTTYVVLLSFTSLSIEFFLWVYVVHEVVLYSLYFLLAVKSSKEAVLK